MDTSRPAVQFCIQGTQAEYQGRLAEAKAFYEMAWESTEDNMDRCIAAHYMARFQETSEDRLRWNQQALDFAKMVDDRQLKDFYPSLYLNMGQSYEELGNQEAAKYYFNLATSLGAQHQAFSR